MSNESRAAFEAWAAKEGIDTNRKNGDYIWSEAVTAWIGWQASRKVVLEAPTQRIPDNCGSGHCSCVECLKTPEPGERETLIANLRKNGEGCMCEARASIECSCGAVWGTDFAKQAADMLAAET